MLEDRDVNVLPIYTASLKAIDEFGWPAAFQFFKHTSGIIIDVLINTVSFAMQEGNAVNSNEDILQQLDVPILNKVFTINLYLLSSSY